MDKTSRLILRDNALESEVQGAIIEYLKARRIKHTITEAKRSFNEDGNLVRRVSAGWPDITACGCGGYLIGIECKRANGGELSYEQAIELDGLHQSGALIVIARSIDDVEELLRTKRTSQATIVEIVKALAKGPDLKKIARQKRSAKAIRVKRNGSFNTEKKYERSK